MAMTSSDIQEQSFSIDRKGYDVDEVDVFLEHVANELDDMNALIEQLQGEVDESRFSGFDKPAARGGGSDELAEKDRRISELERQLEEREADGNAIAQALIIAQRSGDEIIAAANADAAGTRQDAEDEAERILDKANAEKHKIMEAIKELEEDREDTRADYQDLLKDFINSATKKLVDIGGEGTPPASAHAKFAAPKGSASKFQAPIRKEPGSPGVSYATPPAGATASVAPVTPKPSKPEKDLSGFGDADDTFEFEDVD